MYSIPVAWEAWGTVGKVLAAADCTEWACLAEWGKAVPHPGEQLAAEVLAGAPSCRLKHRHASSHHTCLHIHMTHNAASQENNASD